MNFKVNDLVRVKSFKEIKKTLDEKNCCHGVYFNSYMRGFCSKIFRIQRIKKIDDTISLQVFLKAENGSKLASDDFWTWDADWLERVEEDKRNTTFPIDVSDLNKAIEEVKRLHSESSKHRLSGKEMDSVKTLMGEYAAKAIEKGYSLVFYVYENGKRVELRTDFGSSSRTGDLPQKVSAQCSPDDEFNPTVGKFVCLCKLLGHKVPSWI